MECPHCGGSLDVCDICGEYDDIAHGSRPHCFVPRELDVPEAVRRLINANAAAAVIVAEERDRYRAALQEIADRDDTAGRTMRRIASDVLEARGEPLGAPTSERLSARST